MKQLKLAAALAAVLLASGAHAQSNFTGLSAGLNLNLVRGSTEISEDDIGDISKQAVAIGLDGAYSMAMGERSVVALGIEVDLSKPKFGKSSIEGITIEIKQKSRWALSIAPGYAVSPDTLVYGKLSYNMLEGEISAEGYEVASGKSKGLGFGAGVKTMLSNTMYLKAEAQYIDYKEKMALTLRRPSPPSASV
jgi:opacity protein-like surface antigen